MLSSSSAVASSPLDEQSAMSPAPTSTTEPGGGGGGGGGRGGGGGGGGGGDTGGGVVGAPVRSQANTTAPAATTASRVRRFWCRNRMTPSGDRGNASGRQTSTGRVRVRSPPRCPGAA